MARERSSYKAFGAKTLAASSACLVYGAMLSSRTGSASLILYDHSSMGTAPITRVAMRIYLANASGTVSVVNPTPVQFNHGLMCSMSAKGVGTVFFSKRA